ncbi:MAG TPA: hypothetical protein DHU96_09485 [Actinobacteria bacterium]|nr:hypothetical protein [Actinomycetota bacterium]
MLNAARTACRRGHLLEGGNLVMVRGRGGKLFRRCRECVRRRNARAERLRRQLRREAQAAAA